MFLAIAVLCGLMHWPSLAEAALITIEIEALVDSVWDSGNHLEGKIEVGDIITGTYTYDLSTPDSEPLPYAGIYEHHSAPTGISLSVAGFDFTTDPDNVAFVVAILNGYPPSGQDQVWMTSYNNLPLSNGVAVDIISWQLDDPRGTAIHSTEVSTVPLVLDNWESFCGLRIHGERGGYIIDATVTRAIPEPVTVLFLGFGGLFLRKRWCT